MEDVGTPGPTIKCSPNEATNLAIHATKHTSSHPPVGGLKALPNWHRNGKYLIKKKYFSKDHLNQVVRWAYCMSEGLLTLGMVASSSHFPM